MKDLCLIKIPSIEDIARQVAVTEEVGYGQGNPVILGGVIKENEVEDYLNCWQIPFEKMRWCIWEWSHCIKLSENNGLPENISLLERGRIFGEIGDLNLRREGDLFRWNYIGSEDIALPAQFLAFNFWQQNKKVRLRLWDNKKALLWGILREGSVRIEKRVGSKILDYPPKVVGNENVLLKYREYTEAGRSAFIWWYDLLGVDKSD